MARVKSRSIGDLRREVAHLAGLTGSDLSIGQAYGGYRVEMDRGARELSPRLTKQELTVWLDGALSIAELIERHRSRPNPPRKVRQPPTERKVFAAHERRGHITTSGRRALPASKFALPPGPEEKRRGIKGRVPFDTIRRARSGLARLSMMHNRGEITKRQMDAGRGKILKAWPSIDERRSHHRRNPPADYMMDERYASILREADMDPDHPPEDYAGIAYLVSVIYEGALEDDWLVLDRDAALDQAELLADEEEPGEPVEYVVSEVYVGEDTIEGTGYMTDVTFRPVGSEE